jgi:hypothetical protein
VLVHQGGPEVLRVDRSEDGLDGLVSCHDSLKAPKLISSR